MRRDPLDLRLLPAAAVCWAVALLAIVSSARIALGLGTTLLGVSVLTAAGVWASVQRPGRREDSRASTIRLVAVQIVMCFGLAGGVALSTGLSQHQLEHSGWTEAVTSDLPLTVTVRLRADPQPIATESFAGEPRQRAEVHVLDYREAGESQPESVDTSAVLFTDADEELKVGARYQTQVMVSPADQDERATAVLRPFTSGHGDHWAQEVGEDAW